MAPRSRSDLREAAKAGTIFVKNVSGTGDASRLRRLLDALGGSEGARLTANELLAFYAREYVRLNPDLDVRDARAKAAALLQAVRRAGLPRTRTLLEVGCGSGAVLATMRAGLGADFAVGIDYGLDQARIAHISTRSPALVADGSCLPLREDAFDLAYFTDVLEHVLDPVALLREVARVARYVGFLVPLEAGLLANPLYAYRRLRGKPTNREQYGHIWRWFRRQALGLFRSAGLTLLCTVPYIPEPKATSRTAMGRAVESARAATVRLSPRLAGLVFGGEVLLGLATRRQRTS